MVANNVKFKIIGSVKLQLITQNDIRASRNVKTELLQPKKLQTKIIVIQTEMDVEIAKQLRGGIVVE